MVASGHALATEAGLEMLRKGGNAFDAGVATLMALNVTRPMSAGMVGVAPTLIYDANAKEVSSYNGLGTAPGKMTPQYLRDHGWIVAPIFGINSQLIRPRPTPVSLFWKDTAPRASARFRPRQSNSRKKATRSTKPRLTS